MKNIYIFLATYLIFFFKKRALLIYHKKLTIALEAFLAFFKLINSLNNPQKIEEIQKSKKELTIDIKNKFDSLNEKKKLFKIAKFLEFFEKSGAFK